MKTQGKEIFVPGSGIESGKFKLPAAKSLANSVFAHTPPSLIEPGNESQNDNY